MVDAQEWLDEKYSNKEEVREIYGEDKQISGELIIADFPQVEKINVNNNQLTQLHLNNCPQLIYLDCGCNKLTELTITNCPNLQTIYAYDNQLTNLDLSNNQQLEELSIRDNNFTGSLEPLRNLNKLERLSIHNTKISQGLEYLPVSLKDFYCQRTKLEKELKPFWGDWKKWREEWQKWKEQGFTAEQIREWLNAGATISDYEFVAWFRDTKNLGSDWVSNYQEDYQILSERFKKYGLCSKCQQLNTGEKWCQPCNAPRLQNDFNNWDSGNLQINQFIQKYQFEATSADKLLEWIPYEQFAEIEHIATGGFGKVYKAKWKEGFIEFWNKKKLGVSVSFLKGEWKRSGLTTVVLKSLNNSQENTDFLDETAKHKDIDDWFNNIVPCYGLSQHPQTKDYLMVMKYMPEGNLRSYLNKNNRELTLENKFHHLVNISQGLKDIHNKNLVHRDFHSGNILKGLEKTSCLITDLGLCKPVSEINKEESIFGVLPYVAP